ncbi:hypothetical protein D3C74_409700 [compost metagenome]
MPSYLFNQLKTVHSRHLDVCNKQVYIILAELPEMIPGLQPVAIGTDNLNFQIHSGSNFFKPTANHFLIVRNHDPDHQQIASSFVKAANDCAVILNYKLHFLISICTLLYFYSLQFTLPIFCLKSCLKRVIT